MTVKVSDINNARTIAFDGANPKLPQSVFILGPQGLCIEFDRATLVNAVCREFGLARIEDKAA